jgi:VWFA-related protein
MRMTLPRRLAFTLVLAAALAALTGLRLQTYAQAGDRERTLFVSAIDQKGEPVDNLAPGDVIIREDGVRREVLRLSRATEPIDIALLVDNSASADDSISHIREALRRFIARTSEGNQIALVALADRPTILVDYTSDPKRLEAGIGRLFPMSMSGMTLLDAIVEVSRGLARRETARVAIVPVINDGVEFTNRYYRDVIAELKAASAPLHAITVGDFHITGEQATRERAYVLDQGTRESGGQRVTLLSPMGLATALDKLARELLSQYKVVYGRPQSLIPPEKLDVSSARRGVTLRGAPMRGQAGA